MARRAYVVCIGRRAGSPERRQEQTNMRTFNTIKELQTFIQGAIPLMQIELVGANSSDYSLTIVKGKKNDWKHIVQLSTQGRMVIPFLGGGNTIDSCYRGFLHEMARDSFNSVIDNVQVRDFDGWKALLADKTAMDRKLQDIDNDIQDNQ